MDEGRGRAVFGSAKDLLRRLDLEGWSETRSLEFKSGQKWDDLKPRLAKAALAMSNIDGGGRIIVGIGEDTDKAAGPEGMPREIAQAYDQDRVSAYINGFADPPIDMEVRRLEDDGRFFVEIRVREFAAEPVICKKNGEGIRQAVLYYRGHRMPQSAPVASSAEMRDIVDRAVDKAFQRQRRRVRSYPQQQNDRFADEEKEEHVPDAAKIMKIISEIGHWEIRIRPAEYPCTPNRLGKLEDVLRKSQAPYYFASYPFGPQSQQVKTRRLGGCIESCVYWSGFASVSRLYASGQFVHHMAMHEDLVDHGLHAFPRLDPLSIPPNPPEQPFMDPVSILHYLTQIYKFASRIAQEGVLGDEAVVRVALHGQRGRILKPKGRPLLYHGGGRCNASEITLGPHRATPDELRGDHDGMAVRDAAAVLEKYNVDDGVKEILRGWQDDYYQGKLWPEARRSIWHGAIC